METQQHTGESKDHDIVPKLTADPLVRAPKRAKLDATNMQVAMKREQAVSYGGRPTKVTHIMTPAASTVALNSTSQFSMYIEADSVRLLKDGIFRFRVNNASGGSITPVATPLWWERIEVYDRHSSAEIARCYGDVLYWFLMSQDEEVLRNWSSLIGYDPTTYSQSPVPQANNTTRYYWMPWPYAFWTGLGLDMSLMRGDIEIKFFPKGNISVGAEAVSLTEVALVSDTELMTLKDHQHWMQTVDTFAMRHQYIDSQRYRLTGQTLAAGLTYNFELDAFHHMSAGLVLCIRDEANTPNSNLNNASTRYLALEGGTIDHKSLSGQSVFGRGRPVPSEYMRYVVGTDLFNNNFIRYNAVYCVPFTHNIHAALAGEIDGFHEFRGDRELLEVVMPPAVVPEVQTITGVGTAVATDFIKISYKGAYTAGFAANTALAVIQPLVNALPTVVADGITVVLTGDTFDQAACATVFTITTIQGQGVNLGGASFQAHQAFVDVAGASTLSALNTTLTTPGIPGGWPATVTTYQVDIYSLYTREITFSRGRLFVKDA